MLAVLRFSFSKELKFVRARLGKPYNSALGTSSPLSPSLPPSLSPSLSLSLSDIAHKGCL